MSFFRKKSKDYIQQNESMDETNEQYYGSIYYQNEIDFHKRTTLVDSKSPRSSQQTKLQPTQYYQTTTYPTTSTIETKSTTKSSPIKHSNTNTNRTIINNNDHYDVRPTIQHQKSRYVVQDKQIGFPTVIKQPIISNNDTDDCFIDKFNP